MGGDPFYISHYCWKLFSPFGTVEDSNNFVLDLKRNYRIFHPK
jgi:hypothetical protein